MVILFNLYKNYALLGDRNTFSIINLIAIPLRGMYETRMGRDSNAQDYPVKEVHLLY